MTEIGIVVNVVVVVSLALLMYAGVRADTRALKANAAAELYRIAFERGQDLGYAEGYADGREAAEIEMQQPTPC